MDIDICTVSLYYRISIKVCTNTCTIVYYNCKNIHLAKISTNYRCNSTILFMS